MTSHTHQSLNRVALSATVHCLTGCAIGEMLGMVIPGPMDATLDDIGFYLALAVALLIAGVAAFPANRWLIRRGKGHAVVHEHHAH